MPKIAIVVLSFEIISSINLDYLRVENVNLIKNLLLISSFLSLLIGTIVGLSQIKIKRLLAYSTISHVGFMLLALSVNTEESLESLLFYLIQYSFTNLNTFFILLAFGYIIKKSINNPYINKEGNKDISLIKELKGQFFTNPLLSLSLAVCLFSMAGIPPLMGFFAKAEVLYSAVNNGYYFISIVAIIVSVISAYYYLQIIRVMHFDNNNSLENGFFGETFNIKYNPNSFNTNLHISNIHSFIISLLTLSLIFFILKPSILLNSIHLVALNVFIT
jgi:NADH-ubiquinone oxidoreductase chain 2